MSDPRKTLRQRTVRIGQRLVGDGQPMLIIAEAGVNHDGAVDKARKLVDAAAEAGADMVKFQMFSAAELTTENAAAAEYQKDVGATTQRGMLRRLELSDDDFERIVERCRQRSIEFLATPFGPADVERLVKLGVSAIKTASTDLNNVPLLQAAGETGLPLMVSTGASTAEEIAAAVERLRSWGAFDRLILLHCVSSYPTPLESANLRAIGALRDEFNVPVGYSDHTEHVQIAGWAVAAGASVLEKHFTLDRRSAGPDHAMSLEPRGLAAYVEAAREAERALGTGRIGMTALEADVRAVARRSVVAIDSIEAGTVLTPEMLTVKRPAGGITPDRLHELVGRPARIAIAADTAITWEMIA